MLSELDQLAGRAAVRGGGRGDNVVAFPGPVQAAAPRLGSLSDITAALAVLGEPARVSELKGLLDLTVDMPRSQIVSLLVAHGEDALGAGAPMALFRHVMLEGDVAWAFTPQFRQVMRANGVWPRLRGEVWEPWDAVPGSD